MEITKYIIEKIFQKVFDIINKIIINKLRGKICPLELQLDKARDRTAPDLVSRL